MPIDDEPSDTTDEPVLSERIAVGDGRDPVEGRIELTESDRVRVAAFLKIEQLNGLAFDYRLTPMSKGRFHLTGDLHADLTRVCVVTLEPMAERIEESVDLECRPEGRIDSEPDEEAGFGLDGLPEDPPVPIVKGRIDLGALAVELVASAMDPYPRKDEAEFDWEDPKSTGEDAPLSPFADLAKLKSKN